MYWKTFSNTSGNALKIVNNKNGPNLNLHKSVVTCMITRIIARGNTFCKSTRDTKKSNSSVIRQKGESQNGCFKKTKHVEFSEKTNISNPLIRVRVRTPFCLITDQLTTLN